MTKIEKTQTLYETLIKAEALVQRHRRLLIALPKKKVLKFERLLGVAIKDLMNAKSKFNGAAKKLTPPELLELHNSIHKR